VIAARSAEHVSWSLFLAAHRAGVPRPRRDSDPNGLRWIKHELFAAMKQVSAERPTVRLRKVAR
jgi:hypothetical protein